VNVSGGFSKVVRMVWVGGVGDDGWVEDKEANKEVREVVDITKFNNPSVVESKRAYRISLIMTPAT